MQRFENKIIILLLFICGGAIRKPVAGETFGNLYTTSLIDSIEIRRFGIPLMVREETVKFPAATMDNGSDQQKYVLHRIEHISHLENFKCSPDVQIISGGIHFPNATMVIRSKRGCGIDSTLEFYGLEQQKPYPNFDLKV